MKVVINGISFKCTSIKFGGANTQVKIENTFENIEIIRGFKKGEPHIYSLNLIIDAETFRNVNPEAIGSIEFTSHEIIINFLGGR